MSYFPKVINLVFGAFLFLLGISSFAQTQNTDSIYANGARTYYEAIDFSSPESISKTFISAWRKQDYITFYVSLTPKVQRDLYSFLFARWNMGLFFLNKADDIRSDLEENLPIANLEAYTDLNLWFDYLFRIAYQHDALPFTLGQKANIDKVYQDNKKTLVIINTDGNPKKITLYLEKIQISNRWKIAYIQIPNYMSKSPLWGNNPMGSYKVSKQE